MTGQPAVSLALHWTLARCPSGVQLVAAYGREDLLVRVASQLERAAPWAERHCPSTPSRPPGPQLPDFPAGQLGPGVTLAGTTVIAAMTLPAPWLESDPDVIAEGIDRRPVLRRFTAISTGGPLAGPWAVLTRLCHTS